MNFLYLTGSIEIACLVSDEMSLSPNALTTANL